MQEPVSKWKWYVGIGTVVLLALAWLILGRGGLAAVGGVLCAAGILFGFGNVWWWKKSWRGWLGNILIIAVAVVGLRFAMPEWFHFLTFDVIFKGFSYILPFIATIATGYFSWKFFFEREKIKWILTGIVPQLLVVCATLMFTHTVEDFIFYKQKEMQFTPISKPIEADARLSYWMPPEVAYWRTLDDFTYSRYTLEFGYQDQTFYRGEPAYIIPTTPDDYPQIWTAKNKGFHVYRGGASEEVFYEQTDGEGMEITDDIMRNLYDRDMWADYPDIQYHELGSDTVLTGVAHKIKYSLNLPFYLTPYWAGVVLFDSTGIKEDLTVEQVKSDPRFAGIDVYPEWLTRERAQVQIYEFGWLNGLWFRKPEEKIEIPTLPGDHQWPNKFMGVDGNIYHKVCVEPIGQSHGLLKIYYVNTHTGEGSVYSPKTKVKGPISALTAAMSSVDYTWWQETQGGAVGNTLAIRPEEFVRNGRHYFRVSIVSVVRYEGGKISSDIKYSGLKSVVVVDGESDEGALVGEFRTKEEFLTWYYGDDYVDPTGSKDEIILFHTQRIEFYTREIINHTQALRALTE